MLLYNKMGREGVTENVTFAQRPEAIEKSSHVDIWRECYPGRGKDSNEQRCLQIADTICSS